MKTKLEIICYVVGMVALNGRAVNETAGGCELETSDGRRCFVSLCLTDQGRERIVLLGDGTGGLKGFHSDQPDDFVNGDYLRPEFRGHSFEFWRELQLVHDNWDGNANTWQPSEKHFWNDNYALSELGRNRLKEISEMP